MHNEERVISHKKMPRGPGMGPRVAEKPKNFKHAMKRLIKELKDFKLLIIISLVLAILGAILSILAPNKLSSMTDEISKGLVVNKDNIEKLSSSITENLTEENLKSKISQVLNFDLSEEKIRAIMSDNTISQEEKIEFQNVLAKLKQSQNQEEIFGDISNLSTNILKYLFDESIYDGINITVENKLELLSFISNIKDSNIKNIELSEGLQTLLFSKIEIDGIKISR